MDYSQYAEKHHLDITIDDRVALVKMNRPDTRNTMNNAMHVGLERLLPELGIDADVGAIVLTGAGTDFSIGGDLDDQERARERGVKTILREAKYIVQSFANCEAPIIAGRQWHRRSGRGHHRPHVRHRLHGRQRPDCGRPCSYSACSGGMAAASYGPCW